MKRKNKKIKFDVYSGIVGSSMITLCFLIINGFIMASVSGGFFNGLIEPFKEFRSFMLFFLVFIVFFIGLGLRIKEHPVLFIGGGNL